MSAHLILSMAAYGADETSVAAAYHHHNIQQDLQILTSSSSSVTFVEASRPREALQEFKSPEVATDFNVSIHHKFQT